MEHQCQFRPIGTMPYSVRSLFRPSSSAFLASCLNGILAVVAVEIGRISVNAETG